MAETKRLGIMQPYFFPYPGHFALIAAVDEWIVFDITQYTPKSWMNRNRILHPQTGWQYVTVPLANSSIHIKTAEAQVLDPAAAKQNVLAKLNHYHKRAPFFKAVYQLVEETFAATATHSLVQLNVCGLHAVCRYLDIPFNYKICSELNLDLPADLGPGDWALEISAQVGASTYINPAGGQHLFDPSAFAARQIELQIAHFSALHYLPRGYEFESNLSILDALMWLEPEAIKQGLLEGLRLEKLS